MTSYIVDKYNIETCSICLFDIYNNDILFTTDCNHSFHASCILPWFANNHSCPICRQEIIFDYNFFENLTDIVVENVLDNHEELHVVDNDEELHEDLVYYLLLREVLVVVNDIDYFNNIRNINIHNSYTYVYTQLNPLSIYRRIMDYIYTNVLYFISYIRNIDLNYCILNNYYSLYVNNNDIDPYYNLPYY
jgi:hypothetical protein